MNYSVIRSDTVLVFENAGSVTAWYLQSNMDIFLMFLTMLTRHLINTQEDNTSIHLLEGLRLQCSTSCILLYFILFVRSQFLHITTHTYTYICFYFCTRQSHSIIRQEES